MRKWWASDVPAVITDSLFADVARDFVDYVGNMVREANRIVRSDGETGVHQTEKKGMIVCSELSENALIEEERCDACAGVTTRLEGAFDVEGPMRLESMEDGPYGSGSAPKIVEHLRQPFGQLPERRVGRARLSVIAYRGNENECRARMITREEIEWRQRCSEAHLKVNTDFGRISVVVP